MNEVEESTPEYAIAERPHPTDVLARRRLLEEVRDLLAQEIDFATRADEEGFDLKSSIRIALTNKTDGTGAPVIAAVGAEEGLPDFVFPSMTKGFSVTYRAVSRDSSTFPVHVSMPELPEETRVPLGESAVSGGA
ncbi:MAG: hypothetical protein M1606_00880 [Candidatus Thermoplasmatota archaeon]|jgi:hypothetical protein|nr:hypothetical protein [Candidatus Thermoplasmatota archaeon]MCL5983204.1 hypothetical protein [Candidatus Thermoplasmatota archaeon]